MKKWLRWFVLFSLLLVPAVILFFASSDPGLNYLVSLCNRLSAGRLTIRSASGSLFSSLQFQGIRYADTIDSVDIETLAVTCDPTRLLNKHPQIQRIHASGIRITLGPSEQEVYIPPPFSLPIGLLIQEISAEKITIFSNQKEIVVIQTGTIKHLSFQEQTLAFDDLSLSTEEAALQMKGQLQTSDGYPLQLALESLHHPAGYESISSKGTLRGPINHLELDADVLNPFPVHLQGQINNLLGKLTWKARLEGNEMALQKINRDWPDQRFTNVAIDGEGSLGEYTLHLHSSAGVQQIDKSVELSADIQGNLDGLRVDDLRLAHGKAVLSGTGALAWSPVLSWKAEVSGSHLDPSILLTDWPGDFSCTLKTAGQFIENEIDASFYLPQLKGILRNFPLAAKGEGTIKGTQLQIPQLVVTSAGSTLRLSGTTTEIIDLSLRLDSNNLAELWPNARGAVHAEARLTGNPVQPQIELKLTGTDMGLGSSRVKKLTVESKGYLSKNDLLEATIKAEQLQFGSTMLNSSGLRFRGSMNDHTITVEGQNSDFTTGLMLVGKTTDKRWQGTLRQMHFTSLQFGNWQQWQTTQFAVSPDRVEMEPLCLASQTSGKVCLNGSWLESSNIWLLHGTASSLPLDSLKKYLHNPWPMEGQLNGTIDLTGRQFNILTGKLHCEGIGMSMHIPLPEDTEHIVRWKKNLVRADYANNQLQTVLDSELTDTSALHMDLRLTNLTLPQSDWSQTPLHGAVQLQMHDLNLLTVLTEQLISLTGSLQGKFMLNGTPVAPLITGQVELTNGKAEIPQLGITLSPLLVTMKGDANNVLLKATAYSGSGYLRAESNLNMAKTNTRANTILLTGDAFKVAHVPGLDLDISPDLQVMLEKDQTYLRGTVKIPKARITSIDFYNSTAHSSDVIVIDNEQEPAPPASNWPIHTSVTVTTGDDVQIDAYGLQGTITGNLQVTGQPDRLQVGNGTLTVQKGSFTLYGQRLKIDLGRLLFTGGPLTNPGIELRSENNSDKMTTGVIVRGFLQHPELTFYSNPSMEQSVIVSRLLETTSIGGSTRQDTGFIGKAIAKIGLGGMNPYLQTVKKLSMVDDIKLETGKNFDSLSLVFGSWLTPNFYVSYGKNLQKESGNFNTRSTLGKGFYFMTETGALQSGGDLKYEFER